MSKDATVESVFQNEMIARMQANGWLLVTPELYDREAALHTSDVLAFVKNTRPKGWAKLCKTFPGDPEKNFISHLVTQLKKANPNAIEKDLRSYGTLGVLRHGLKIRNARFSLCQFMPEHNLNPDTLVRYKANRCRIVPELVYSPCATDEHLAETGKKAKAWRIDLALFIDGFPVATLELKPEFKQQWH